MEALQKKARHGARSYRRGREPESGLRETLLVQCIVSGIILFIALGISFLPIKSAASLRAGIKNALSQESSVESVSQAAEGVTGKYNEIKTSIKKIFGGADAPEPTPETVAAPAEAPQTEPEPSGSADSAQVSDMDARIDESLLQSINSDDFYEAGDSEKK